MTIALFVVYALLGVCVGRVFAGHALYYENGVHPRGEDKAWAFGAFVLATVAWPAFVIGWLWNHSAEAFVHKSPVTKARLETERKDRLRAVAEENERRSRNLLDTPEQWR